MKARHARLLTLCAGLAGLGGAAALVLNAFESNLVFFFSPSQVVAKAAPIDRNFRIGGLVQAGSIEREANGLGVRFVVTDTVHSVAVRYEGLLPDLFQEGKGVVAQGKLSDQGLFKASQVLAKHDENYMPPEAAGALAQAKAQAETPAPAQPVSYSPP